MRERAAGCGRAAGRKAGVLAAALLLGVGGIGWAGVGEPETGSPPPPAAVASKEAAGTAAGGNAAAAATDETAATAAGGSSAESAIPEAGDGEALARQYRTNGLARAIERQGETLVPFGHGRPVVRCAPLRACAVELEAGETVLATASGDSERWLIQTAAAGNGGSTPLVVVKPTGCDLATNLLIATDRRVYELGLESPPCGRQEAGGASGWAGGAGAVGGAGAAGGGGGAARGNYNPRLPYTALLRFYYPDQLVRRWAREEDAAARRAQRETAGRTELGPAAVLAHLNFDYSWARDKGYAWTPAQVFDDGERTYIVVPPAARRGEAPALFALQADGTTALLNYRVEGDTYIADRVIERAVLMSGGGGGSGGGRGRKAAERLEIIAGRLARRQR